MTQPAVVVEGLRQRLGDVLALDSTVRLTREGRVPADLGS